MKRLSFIVAHDKPYHFEGGTTGFFMRNIENIDIISLKETSKVSQGTFTALNHRTAFILMLCLEITLAFDVI